MTTTTRFLCVGWFLPHQPIVIVESPAAVLVRKELESMDADLKALRAEVRPVFRLTHEQECELEDERPEQPGVAEIAPYISF